MPTSKSLSIIAANSADGQFIASCDPRQGSRAAASMFGRSGQQIILQEDDRIGYVLVSRISGNYRIEKFAMHPEFGPLGLEREILEILVKRAERDGLEVRTKLHDCIEEELLLELGFVAEHTKSGTVFVKRRLGKAGGISSLG